MGHRQPQLAGQTKLWILLAGRSWKSCYYRNFAAPAAEQQQPIPGRNCGATSRLRECPLVRWSRESYVPNPADAEEQQWGDAIVYDTG